MESLIQQQDSHLIFPFALFQVFKTVLFVIGILCLVCGSSKATIIENTDPCWCQEQYSTPFDSGYCNLAFGGCQIGIVGASAGTCLNSNGTSLYFDVLVSTDGGPAVRLNTVGDTDGHIDLSWGFLPGTAHTLTIICESSQGDFFTAPTVTVKDDETPPSLQILTPVSGSTLPASSPITIGGFATDDSGIQNLTIDFGRFFSTSTAGGSFNVVVASSVLGSIGTEIVDIRILTYDLAANATAEHRLVTIDNTPPTVAISTPSLDIRCGPSGCDLTELARIAGTAADDIGLMDHVVLWAHENSTGKYWNGSSFTALSPQEIDLPLLLISTSPGAFGTWSYSAITSANLLQESSYTIMVQAADEVGNRSVTASTFIFGITPTLVVAGHQVCPNPPKISNPPFAIAYSPNGMAKICATVSPPTSLTNVQFQSTAFTATLDPTICSGQGFLGISVVPVLSVCMSRDTIRVIADLPNPDPLQPPGGS